MPFWLKAWVGVISRDCIISRKDDVISRGNGVIFAPEYVK
jgi:hypothetical protein